MVEIRLSFEIKVVTKSNNREFKAIFQLKDQNNKKININRLKKISGLTNTEIVNIFLETFNIHDLFPYNIQYDYNKLKITIDGILDDETLIEATCFYISGKYKEFIKRIKNKSEEIKEKIEILNEIKGYTDDMILEYFN